MTINGLCTHRVLLLPGAQSSSQLIISVILPVVPRGGWLSTVLPPLKIKKVTNWIFFCSTFCVLELGSYLIKPICMSTGRPGF